MRYFNAPHWRRQWLKGPHPAGAIRDLRRPDLLDAVHHERAVEDERSLRGRTPKNQQVEGLASSVLRAERSVALLPDDKLAFTGEHRVLVSEAALARDHVSARLERRRDAGLELRSRR